MGRLGTGQDRFMVIGPDRVLYVGLLGAPSIRSLGAIALYVSLSGSAEVQIGGGVAQRAPVVVVPHQRPHLVTSGGRSIACLLVEPESVSDGEIARLGTFADGNPAAAELAERVRGVCARSPDHRDGDFTTSDVDRSLFGRDLERRPLDPRIAAVVARFRTPLGLMSGGDCARIAELSVSRFLHLFKRETTVSFKAFRAWKRARSLLEHANRDISLTELALDIGYPDSTHFSHSIRRIYGLQPSAIFSGSRRLRIIRGETAESSGGRFALSG